MIVRIKKKERETARARPFEWKSVETWQIHLAISPPLESIPNFPWKWDVWTCISRAVWGDQLQGCCRLPLSSNARWLRVWRVGKIGKHHVNDSSVVWLRISFSASLLFISICEGGRLINSSGIWKYEHSNTQTLNSHVHIITIFPSRVNQMSSLLSLIRNLWFSLSARVSKVPSTRGR